MNELTPLLEAWRVMSLGTGEVVDGLVAVEHRGPSPQLTGVLAEGTCADGDGALCRNDRSTARPLDGGAG